VEVGATIQLGAQRVRGPVADNVTASAIWQSDNEAVVTVSYDEDKGAVAKAVGPGSARIVAQAEGAIASAVFLVDAPVSSVELDSSLFELAIGSSLPMGAVLITQDAKKRAFDSGAWGSSNPAVATVDERGTISALGEGSSEITLVRDGSTTSQLIAGRRWELQALTAQAAKGSLLVDQSTSLRVVGTFTGAHEQTLTSFFSWSVPTASAQEEEDPIITVTGSTVTAVKVGAARVVGTGRPGSLVDGQILEVALTVVDASTLSLLRFELPPQLSIQRSELPLTLIGTFDTLEVAAPEVTFTVEPANILFVDERKGVITPLAAGTVTLTASADPQGTKDDITDDITAVASITVSDAPLSLLELQLAAASVGKLLSVDGTLALRALASFGPALQEDAGTPAIWTSDDPSIAAVSNVSSGIVTGRSAGTTIIRASYLGLTASLPVLVQPPAIP
jgi:uncharacterized protein YjdB